MFIQDPDGVFEFLRGTFPYYAFVFLPLLIVFSPMTPVFGAHEFTVYRMHHWDYVGSPHGCRSAAVSVEARTLSSPVFTRRCVLAHVLELTVEKYQDIVSQGAGGLLVLLPENIGIISDADREHIMHLERVMLKEEVAMPVYFAQSTPEIEEIYDSIQQSSSNEQAGTAMAELMGSLTASGYKMVGSVTQTKANSDLVITNIQGKLSGFGVEEQLPTIAVIAHYDSFGVAPTLSFGADSNGSGVAALLELARLLSRLYTSSRTHPRFNVLFLLSGAGKFNFQGTKKWIEDSIDSSEGSLLPDSLYSLCLDSIGSSGDDLYMHVSKPPKEGSHADNFWKELQIVNKRFSPDLNLKMIHKKINLADDALAWEHERFSIRRLFAFTISGRLSKDSQRATITDTKEMLNIEKLSRNVKLIAESLARHIFNLTNEDLTEIFTDGLSVRKDFLKAWTDMLSSQPRSSQILSMSSKNPVVVALEQSISHYLKDVRTISFKPDKREPEIVFYEPDKATMNAYKVKPAVFELFLAVVIGAYLGVVYLIILNFPKLENFMKSAIKAEKQNHHSN